MKNEPPPTIDGTGGIIGLTGKQGAEGPEVHGVLIGGAGKLPGGLIGSFTGGIMGLVGKHGAERSEVHGVLIGGAGKLPGGLLGLLVGGKIGGGLEMTGGSGTGGSYPESTVISSPTNDPICTGPYVSIKS